MRFEVTHPRLPRSRPLAVAVAFLLLLLVAVLDYATGTVLDVAVLYLLPVAGIAWILGRTWGVAAAAAGALLSLAAVLAAAPAGPAWVPYWNAVVLFAVLAGAAVTLPALRTALAREQFASRNDFLTGLANWRAFSEACEDELARARRFARPLTLVFMDCDHFKDVNDTFGHTVGDELLREVGAALASTVREVDTVARLGGDEFVVLLPETDAEASAATVDRMREALALSFGEHERSVTMSMGAATFLQPPASIDEMIATADRLMYDAKHAGRDRAMLGVFGDVVRAEPTSRP